jgi:hypothetical protein
MSCVKCGSDNKPLRVRQSPRGNCYLRKNFSFSNYSNRHKAVKITCVMNQIIFLPLAWFSAIFSVTNYSGSHSIKSHFLKKFVTLYRRFCGTYLLGFTRTFMSRNCSSVRCPQHSLAKRWRPEIAPCGSILPNKMPRSGYDCGSRL